MIFLYIALILLPIIFSLIRFSLITSSVAFLLLDFLIVGGFPVYYFHNNVFPLMASGKALYFWDLILFIFICLIYKFSLSFIALKFPKFNRIIHYILAWLITGFGYIIICAIFWGALPQLLDYKTLNEIINIVFVSLLAFITYAVRKKFFEL